MRDIAKEKRFDDKLKRLIVTKDIEGLEEYLRLGNGEGNELFLAVKSGDKLDSFDELKTIMIARDRCVLGLKDVEESEVYADELILPEELETYNNDMKNGKRPKITKVKAKDKDGKDVTLFYYGYKGEKYPIRQLRMENINGDIEFIQRSALYTDGRFVCVDTAAIGYKYDDSGKKLHAVYQDEFVGGTYIEYDEEGKINLKVSSDAVSKKVHGKECFIDIGNFIPTSNGYVVPEENVSEIKSAEELKISVSGSFIDDEKQEIINGIGEKEREDAFSLLNTLGKYLKEIYNREDLERLDSSSLQRTVNWVNATYVRTVQNPILGIQESDVFTCMRNAIGKNVGDLSAAEKSLYSTNEKEYVRGE